MKAVTEALDRRLDPLSGSPVVVALSGGGDSLALLHLAVEWARTHGRPVLALTLDHGLSPESKGWTREAGAKAEALGAGWRTLTWAGPKPSTGLQAKARAARHALLAEAAREAGARVVLMGHTADDVAEGNLMRQGDAQGLGRLREWSPSPAWPEGRGVFLLRPLLKVGRYDLRAYLTGKGALWLDDPANEDGRFARVRARRALSSLDTRSTAEPWSPASAGMSGEEVGKVAIAAGDVTAPCTLPKPALAALLLCVSGRTLPPRGAELERLMAVIAAGGVATLRGCRIEARGETVRIARAAPRRGESAPPAEPPAWMVQRFHAACGLYPDEASIPPPA